jgi:hypothetical protein
MSAPIIFCHYGNSEYLPYTLQCARHSNPDKDVVLLGDEQNQWLAKACDIRHIRFDDFNYGPELDTFDRVYRVIQGKDHPHLRGSRDWVNFVFRRWFYVGNFLQRDRIGAFWHFDSDNMILDGLARHEHKFQAFDCTEQCNGVCLNGYVSGPDLVHRYLNKINDIFQRHEYLHGLQKNFDENQPGLAFTEMAAYAIFKQEEGLRSIRLSTVLDGSAFDDCICQDQGMETERLPCGQVVKKAYLNPDGRFFCVDKASGQLVRMNSLNLSWVYVYVFANVLAHFQKWQPQGTEIPPDVVHMTTLAACRVPLKYAVKSGLRRIRRALKGFG